MKRFRAMWKACICMFMVSSVLLLTLIMWIPRSARAASITSPRHQYRVQATSVQTTPTVDPTVTALNKEKLTHENDWWWNFGATLITTLISTLALLGGGIFALIRWSGDRRAERDKQQETEKHVREDREAEREKRDEEQKRWLADRQAEREKRDEERFQSVVVGLGSTTKAMQASAAIMLRTFLHPGYEQFYVQAFDLAVAHLRLRAINSEKPEQLDSLSQALITIFKEAFPLARNLLKQEPQFLDASRIQLDHAYLAHADLKQVWLPESFLRNAVLRSADLSEAKLFRANLRRAFLSSANLIGADLIGADLIGADLSRADLSRAGLIGADLSGARLNRADLNGADLSLTYLNGANLNGADLSEADLHGADLSGVDLSSVKSLTKTNMQRTKGIAQEELEKCKVKGAII